VEKVFSALKCADNRGISSLDNADDFPLDPSVPTGASVVARIAEQACDDFVAVKRGLEMIRRDEEIFSSLVFGQHMPGATRVNLKFAGEEIGSLWHDVVIPSDPGQLPVAFQRRESPGECREIIPGDLQ
jgi:hypothetical protein